MATCTECGATFDPRDEDECRSFDVEGSAVIVLHVSDETLETSHHRRP